MSLEANKAILRYHTDEENKGNHDASFAKVARNVVWHGFNREVGGLDDWKRAQVRMFEAWPDIHITINDMIAEGDKVVVQGEAEGTHTGKLPGIAPTGKRFFFRWLAVDRIAGGKVVEHWIYIDRLSLMEQLGFDVFA